MAVAAQTAISSYDVVETLHIASLSIKTINVEVALKGVVTGTYRCIAFRRTNGCVTVVMNGQRYTTPNDLLQLENTLGPQDISHMIFLRPNEAGTLFGSERTNGVLIIVRKGVHK